MIIRKDTEPMRNADVAPQSGVRALVGATAASLSHLQIRLTAGRAIRVAHGGQSDSGGGDKVMNSPSSVSHRPSISSGIGTAGLRKAW